MSNLTISDTDAVWSVPPSERAAALASQPLLILLHGRGSHEGDLFSLVSMLPPAVVVSLRAPLTLGDGFTWFPPAEPGMPGASAAASATEAVLAWLDRVEGGLGTPRSGPTWVLGFSQGGAMTTQLLRFAPERFDAFVNLSGFSIEGELPGDARLETLKPPVFWGRDVRDPIIPQSAVERTDAWLPAHSTLTKREYAGVGHSISREELDDVSEFLQKR
jgi:phospholipase/carboxylesterase